MAVVGVCATNLGSEQSAFSRLFADYRGTEAEFAVNEFANWSMDRTLREAGLPQGQDDAWTLAALALFHLEAGIKRAGFQRDDGDVDDFRFSNANGMAGLNLIERIVPMAHASRDATLLAFCRDWYVVINTLGRVAPSWYFGGSHLQSARQFLGSDAQILALLGADAALRMGPYRQGDGRYGFGHFEDLSGRRIPTLSANGETYNADEVRRAENLFRQSLKASPSVAETRLRLGRVLQLTNRKSGALTELDRAARDAAESRDRFTAYLAALFAGQVHEDAGRITEALAAYERAVAAYPPGVVARLALAHTLVAAGRSDAGWTMSRSIFAAPANAPVLDPWTLYGSFGFRGITARLAKMRALVSRTPMKSFPASPHTPELAMREAGAIAGPAAIIDGDRQTFRSLVDGVRVEVMATNDDGPVSALTADDFRVVDNGVRQQLTSFTSADMLTVAIVVDVSDSLSPPIAWARTQTALDAVRQSLGTRDLVSVVTAGDRLELRADWWPVGDRLATLLQQLRPKPANMTGVWDGVMAGIGLVADARGRGVVIVVSDGFDNLSWFDRKRITPRLKRAGVVVDGIQIPWRGVGPRYGALDVASGDVNLREPALATGGVAFDATDPDLAKKLGERFAALRQSYLLVYSPENVPPQKDGWHEIKVTLRPGLKGKVQARPGYYAPVVKK